MTGFTADSSRNTCLDNLRKLQRCLHRFLFPGPNDSLSNGSCILFLTEAPENICKLLPGQMVYQVGTCGTLLTHTHVKRGVRMVRKSPLGGIKLIRRNTDVQQNAVHAIEAGLMRNTGHFREIGTPHDRTGIPGKTVRHHRHCIGILIDGKQRSRCKAIQDRLGMPSSPASAVYVDTVRF